MDKTLSLLLITLSVICVFGQDSVPSDVAENINPEVSFRKEI